MPWLQDNNPRIDWHLAKVTFANGSTLQAAPCTEKATYPHLLMLLAKQYVHIFGKSGQEAWLVLIRDKTCVQTGLLAPSVLEHIGSKTQQSVEMDALVDGYKDVFNPSGPLYPRDIKHNIDLLDLSQPPPKPRQYIMRPAE